MTRRRLLTVAGQLAAVGAGLGLVAVFLYWVARIAWAAGS